MYASSWWRTMCNVWGGTSEGVGSWFDDHYRRTEGDSENTLLWHDKWVGGVPLRLKFPRLFMLVVHHDITVADMWRRWWSEGGGVWRRRLLAWEKESVRECSSLLHNFILQDNVNDSWRWLLDLTHGYSMWGPIASLLCLIVYSIGTLLKMFGTIFSLKGVSACLASPP